MEQLRKAPWPDWETERLIGRGGFGTVYEIRRKLVDGDTEAAALKVITIPQNQSDIDEMISEGYDEESVSTTFRTYLKNIVSEYSLMRKMDGSANVVNCKDILYLQHEDGIGWDIYIRMELLTPLTKALPANVPETTVIKLGQDICKALKLCKKHEIVHRDIKPQNIFVSDNGDYKLGDFGIAKTMEKTMGGTRIGTYNYMAPEVYNNQPYGAAADIYSLGLVLYWLLNGRRMPFMPPASEKLTGNEDWRYRRLTGEPLPPPANGSPELKRIVLKACAYRPKDRYPSAAAMLADLNALAAVTAVTAPVEVPSGGEKTASLTATATRLETKAKTKTPRRKEKKSFLRRNGKRIILSISALAVAAVTLALLLLVAVPALMPFVHYGIGRVLLPLKDYNGAYNHLAKAEGLFNSEEFLERFEAKPGYCKNTRFMIPTDTTRYAYDEQGNLLRETDYNFGLIKGDRTENEYDAADNLIREIYYDNTGSIERYSEYEYDAAGKQIRANYYDAAGTVNWYKEYAYDAAGNLIRETLHEVDGRVRDYYEYEYDAAGNLIREAHCGADGSVISCSEYEYDNDGKKIWETAYANGKISRMYETEYDGAGNPVSEKCYDVYLNGWIMLHVGGKKWGDFQIFYR